MICIYDELIKKIEIKIDMIWNHALPSIQLLNLNCVPLDQDLLPQFSWEVQEKCNHVTTTGILGEIREEPYFNRRKSIYTN